MKKFLLSGIVLFFGSLLCVSAQELKVSGKVVSSKDGTDLPGVNIQIKGTTRGTITNGLGQYDLMVRSPSDTLLFSFIGHVTAVEVVGQRSTIDIQPAARSHGIGGSCYYRFPRRGEKIIYRFIG